MKAYKIDLSMYEGKVREVVYKACYKHGEKIGYTHNPSDEDYSVIAEAITFESNGEIRFHSDICTYPSDTNNEISAADFLALTTAKDEPTFKPFDKVLVRDHDDREWMPDFYAKLSGNIHVAMSGEWKQCIPYEGNEHLLGTTDAVK